MDNQQPKQRIKFAHLKNRFIVKFFEDNKQILNELTESIKKIELPIIYSYEEKYRLGDYKNDIMITAYSHYDNSTIKEILEKLNDNNIVTQIILTDGHFNEIAKWELEDCSFSNFVPSELEIDNFSPIELYIKMSYTNVSFIF